MRVLALSLSLAAASMVGAPNTAPFVHAVEFPYYLHPPALWERELVWLKAIGVHTVAFSVPWNWHESDAGSFDLTGRTSPRRDLLGFIRLLHRLDMKGWVRPLPPVKNWANEGYPAWAGRGREAEDRWVAELGKVLSAHAVKHGGPIAFVERDRGTWDAPPPPSPLTIVSVLDADALARSRAAAAFGRGTLLWVEAEDTLYPAGWQQPGAPLIRNGAVSPSGSERPATETLRREAALLRNWSSLLQEARSASTSGVRPVSGQFPPGISATLMTSDKGSAISIVNQSEQAFQGDLWASDGAAGSGLVVPRVSVPAKEALWLPLWVSLGPDGMCQECAGFSPAEHVVYSTVELQAIEFENGILAMEFAAPVEGEVVLQFARKVHGPLLAAGKPVEFDWDEKDLRARLPVPAGKGAGHRVRIGLAIEAPESSAFFGDAKRLIIGRTNRVLTSYSSEELAARSRLRAPDGFSAKPVRTSPGEIEYELTVPSSALHGDWAKLAIEADGVLLGRTRLQLFRPVSVYLNSAMRLQFGKTELPVEPPMTALDPKLGRNIDIAVRNNFPQIQTYFLEPTGDRLQFLPPKMELSIGAMMERIASFRVFSEENLAGIIDWKLRVSGAAEMELPMRLVAVPRGKVVTYSADLDADGYPEWVIENPRVRAVFSTQDGGRWLEFVWKDSNLNFLPDSGALVGMGAVRVHAAESALEFSADGWKRIVHLSGAEPKLVIEQSGSPLPASLPPAIKKNDVALEFERESPHRVTYVMRQ